MVLLIVSCINTKIGYQNDGKTIALYYPDARIRKEYLKYLYVYMGEGAYANLGLKTDATEEASVIIGSHVSIAPNVVFITESILNNSKELIYIDIVKNRYPLEPNVI